MQRDKLTDLIAWKESPNRKPLILSGARQVGKTWLLKQFGAEHYASVAYISFFGNTVAQGIFDLDLDPARIIKAIGAYCNMEITPGSTLIILDEVQECPRAISALKNFCEQAPEYHIAVAGSLLGVSLHENSSYPVGKVNSMTLYPLCFAEFVRASGKDSLADLLAAGDMVGLAPFHSTLIELFKEYLVVGGMPEVVSSYLAGGNTVQACNVQQQIISDYIRDFSKHAPRTLLPKIWEIFNIIPAELAKENKKFLFSMIKKGARAAEYEEALIWLENAGVATRVHRAKAVKVPLASYREADAFKLYLVDVGLLGAMAELDPRALLEGDALFTEFKGAMAEQVVFEELVCAGYKPYYYRKDKPSREVDFLLDLPGGILPIEVKSGKNLTSASMSEYIKELQPQRAVKLSQREYSSRGKGIVDLVPIYLAAKVEDVA